MYGHQRGAGRLVQRLLGFFGRPRPHPAEPVRDPVHVRVDADVAAALERQDQHQVGGLPADARQRQQLLHRRRHPAAESSTRSGTSPSRAAPCGGRS